ETVTEIHSFHARLKQARHSRVVPHFGECSALRPQLVEFGSVIRDEVLDRDGGDTVSLRHGADEGGFPGKRRADENHQRMRGSRCLRDCCDDGEQDGDCKTKTTFHELLAAKNKSATVCHTGTSADGIEMLALGASIAVR